MDNKTLHASINDLEQKFDFGILTVSLASMGLSFQYSPAMGLHWPYLLIGSWIFLFLAATAGCLRLMFKPVALKWNLFRNEAQINLREMEDAQFIRSLQMGVPSHDEDWVPWTEARRLQQVEKRKAFIVNANKKWNFIEDS